MAREMSLIRRLSAIGTHLMTLISGSYVGQDQFGNKYYEERKAGGGVRRRRWVIYQDEPEASRVPPEWHGWLHYTMPQPLPTQSPFHRPWQRPYQENKTGTEAAYFPPGHGAAGGKRAKATGDYEAWTPN